MEAAGLGRTYKDGEVIVRQGDPGKRMYVIQAGEVEVLREMEDATVRLVILGEGDFFGEVPFFERNSRDGTKVRATVRTIGEARVLTVDRKTLVRRIHEDPALAYRVLQVMGRRMRDMEDEVARVIVGSLRRE